MQQFCVEKKDFDMGYGYISEVYYGPNPDMARQAIIDLLFHLPIGSLGHIVIFYRPYGHVTRYYSI